VVGYRNLRPQAVECNEIRDFVFFVVLFSVLCFLSDLMHACAIFETELVF
jgi:hypothetical protein